MAPVTAPAPSATLVDCIVLAGEVTSVWVDHNHDHVVVTRRGHDAVVLDRATAAALAPVLGQAAATTRPG